MLKTIAQNKTGVKELADTFLSHFDFMKKNSLIDQKKIAMEKSYFNSLLQDLTLEKLLLFVKSSEEYTEILQKIQAGVTDPLSAAELMINNLKVTSKNDYF